MDSLDIINCRTMVLDNFSFGNFQFSKWISFSLLVERIHLTTTTFNVFCKLYDIFNKEFIQSSNHLLTYGVVRHPVVGGVALQVHPLKGNISLKFQNLFEKSD